MEMEDVEIMSLLTNPNPSNAAWHAATGVALLEAIPTINLPAEVSSPAMQLCVALHCSRD